MNRTEISEWVIGDILDHNESMNIEYKEFCFKENISHYFTKQQISDLCRKSIIPRKFNQIVIFNLCKYIDVYIPKYTCCFHNSVEEDMSFIIGVNDSCEITGIPFNNENLAEYKDVLENHMKKALKKYIGEERCCQIRLKLDIIKCNSDNTVLLDDDFLRNQLKEFDNNQNWLQIKQRKYNKRRKQWIKSILKYKGKLQMVYEDVELKKEFEEYLKENNRLKQFKEVLDDPNTIIDVDTLQSEKQNINSFLYWLIRFKDLKVDELMLVKPISPTHPKLSNIEFSSVSHLSELRKGMIENNKKINYYIFKVSFSRINMCNLILKYKDPFKNNWRAVQRCLNSDKTPRTNQIELS